MNKKQMNAKQNNRKNRCRSPEAPRELSQNPSQQPLELQAEGQPSSWLPHRREERSGQRKTKSKNQRRRKGYPRGRAGLSGPLGPLLGTLPLLELLLLKLLKQLLLLLEPLEPLLLPKPRQLELLKQLLLLEPLEPLKQLLELQQELASSGEHCARIEPTPASAKANKKFVSLVVWVVLLLLLLLLLRGVTRLVGVPSEGGVEWERRNKNDCCSGIGGATTAEGWGPNTCFSLSLSFSFSLSLSSFFLSLSFVCFKERIENHHCFGFGREGLGEPLGPKRHQARNRRQIHIYRRMIKKHKK